MALRLATTSSKAYGTTSGPVLPPRPRNLPAVSSNDDSSKIVDGARGAVLAGDPLGVNQGHWTEAGGHAELGVNHFARRICKVDRQLHGPGVLSKVRRGEGKYQQCSQEANFQGEPSGKRKNSVRGESEFAARII